MGNTSTFGTFTMARLGIFVAQHALNVTGNNISNINTEGYTREKLDQSSMYFGGADRYQSKYDIRENGGVLANGVDQIRDQYLDIRYRNEMTKVGAADAKLDGLKQLDAILDEVAKGEDGEGVLEARFNDFLQQLQELSKDQNAGNDDIDALVRSSAEALAVQFNTYAGRLETLKENVTAQFKQELDETNTTLEKIRDLNETIRKTQIFGGTGLTLKDERNLLIDDLSKKIGINVIYEMENLGDGVEVEKLKITTSGDPSRVLIDGIYGAQLSIVQKGDDVPRKDKAGNPVLDEDGRQVYDKKNIDNDNFDLAISELRDARGKADPANPNEVKRYFETEYVTTDKKAGGYNQNEEWEKFKDDVKLLTFDTFDEALKYEEELNKQFREMYPESGYQTAEERQALIDDDKAPEVPYFHISWSEFCKTDGSGNYIDKDGNRTNDPTKFVFKEGYENKFVVHYHDNEKGKAVNDVTQKFSYANVTDENLTRLSDVELRGSLQAMRELLTESGEYTKADAISLKNSDSVTDQLHYDPEAGTKRGIPYYQKALDTLANVFAEKLNNANTLYGDSYVESLDPKVLYETDKNGKFVDANGVVTNDPTTYVLKDDYKKYYRQNENGLFLDAEGKILTNQNDPTQYVPNDRIIDEKTLFKQDDNGRFVDTNGDPLELETVIDKFDTVSSANAATKFKTQEEAKAVVNRLNSDPTYCTSPTLAKDGKRYAYGLYYNPTSEQYYISQHKIDATATSIPDGDTPVNYVSVTSHEGDVKDRTKLVVKDEYKKYFETENGSFVDKDGNATTDPSKYVLKEAFKSLRGGALFSNSGNTDDTTEITAANISVSNSWAHGLNHVLRTKAADAKKEDGTDNQSRLQDNIRHIITVMGSKHEFKTGNEETSMNFEGTFQQMLTEVIAGTLAKDENITETMLNNYNTTADEIYVDRDAVMGVDLNDEAMNMMQYQKAYSAACRLMTTYDAMLEKLINGTAV